MQGVEPCPSCRGRGSSFQWQRFWFCHPAGSFCLRFCGCMRFLVCCSGKAGTVLRWPVTDKKLWSDWGSAARTYVGYTSCISTSLSLCLWCFAVQGWKAVVSWVIAVSGHRNIQQKKRKENQNNLLKQSVEEPVLSFLACWGMHVETTACYLHLTLSVISASFPPFSIFISHNIWSFFRCPNYFRPGLFCTGNQRAPLQGCRKLTGESVVMLPVVSLTVV